MPADRVQVVLLKLPVLLVVNVTVPVGVVAPVPEASAAVAVQVDGVLSKTLEGVQDTVVVDARICSVNVTVVEFVTEPLVAVTVAVSV